MIQKNKKIWRFSDVPDADHPSPKHPALGGKKAMEQPLIGCCRMQDAGQDHLRTGPIPRAAPDVGRGMKPRIQNIQHVIF